MRTSLPHRAVKKRPRRPTTVLDGQDRPLGCIELLDLIRNHLDRRHPDSQESADDLLAVARTLGVVEIPESYRDRVIRRLIELDGSRNVLGWPDLEQDLHALLSKLLSRLQHTHPRRASAVCLPTTDRIGFPDLQPFQEVAVELLAGLLVYLPELNERGEGLAEGYLKILSKSNVPTPDIPEFLRKLRELKRTSRHHKDHLAWIIRRFTHELHQRPR